MCWWEIVEQLIWKVIKKKSWRGLWFYQNEISFLVPTALHSSAHKRNAWIDVFFWNVLPLWMVSVYFRNGFIFYIFIFRFYHNRRAKVESRRERMRKSNDKHMQGTATDCTIVYTDSHCIYTHFECERRRSAIKLIHLKFTTIVDDKRMD